MAPNAVVLASRCVNSGSAGSDAARIGWTCIGTYESKWQYLTLYNIWVFGGPLYYINYYRYEGEGGHILVNPYRQYNPNKKIMKQALPTYKESFMILFKAVKIRP